MKQFFVNACKFVGRVIAVILAGVSFICLLALSPLVIILGLIFPGIFKFYVVDRHDDLACIASCLPIIGFVLELMTDLGFVPAYSIALYAKKHPYLPTAKAVKKGAKKFSSSTLSSIAQKKEAYFAVPEFTEEFLKRGDRAEEHKFSAQTIEYLASVAYQKRLHKELDEILRATRNVEKKVSELSEGTLLKLLFCSSSDDLCRAIIALYRHEILVEVRRAGKGHLLQELIAKSAPNKQQTIEMLKAYYQSSLYMESYLRLLIQQHGISPDIIAMNGSSYILTDNQMSFLTVYIREREDRMVISKGVEALKTLLKNRDLTRYGQTRLVKKELFETYLEYLESKNLQMGKEEISSLIANADMDVVLILEERFKEKISLSYELTAMLSARKGQ